MSTETDSTTRPTVKFEFSEEFAKFYEGVKTEFDHVVGEKATLESPIVQHVDTKWNIGNQVSNVLFFGISIIGLFIKPNQPSPLDAYLSEDIKALFLKYKLVIMLVIFAFRLFILQMMPVNIFKISVNGEEIYLLGKNETVADKEELIKIVAKKLNIPEKSETEKTETETETETEAVSEAEKPQENEQTEEEKKEN
ncbi:hypothetical protein WA158_000210 [Blastocystis sp. Blastoise]